MSKIGVQWQESILGRHIELIGGQHILAIDVNSTGKGVPYLTGPADFSRGHIEHTKFVENPKTMCLEGDLLLTVKGSGVGSTIVADNAYCISRQLMALRAKDIHKDFLYFIVADVMKNIANSVAIGVIPGISRNDILKIKIKLPSFLEQKKIATILKKWDEAISLTERLIEKKERYLKVMQFNLVNGIGFGSLDKWPVIKLEKIVRKVKGKSTQLNEEGIGIPYIGSTSFSGDFSQYTNETNIVKCCSDDILLLWDGENAGKVTTGLSGAVSSTVCVLKIQGSFSCNEFIYASLDANNLKIRAIREGSGIPHLPGDFLAWYILRLPPLTIQKKIGKSLRHYRKEIDILRAKKFILNDQKNGLMKQLLTGKIRV